MANLNKVMLIGRLTRDPEVRSFSNGGKVAKIGFAVNNRKKDQSGQWVDEPVFVDIDAFNRETGRKFADVVEQYLHKGSQVYIEGHLVLDQWSDKDGQKRSKLKVVMTDFQFLDGKQDGMGGATGESTGMRAPRTASAPSNRAASDFAGNGSQYDEGPGTDPTAPGAPDEDIPF
jgi:single-strand DNA-binding protein